MLSLHVDIAARSCFVMDALSSLVSITELIGALEDIYHYDCIVL